MNERKTDEELKTCLYVDDSSIHGKGVFASSHFKQGEYIGTFSGEETQEDGMHVLWLSSADDPDDCIGILGNNLLRFLNHAHKANAEFSGPHLYATETVAPGDEVTFHYGEEWADDRE